MISWRFSLHLRVQDSGWGDVGGGGGGGDFDGHGDSNVDTSQV